MTALTPAAKVGARVGSRPLTRTVNVLLGAMVVVNIAFAIGLVVSGGDNDPFVNVGLSLAAQWIPVSVFWLVAARTSFRRFPVIFAAAAVTFSAVGDTYYSFAMDADGFLPFPSLADPAYLLFYPLMAAALIAIVRHQLQGARGLVTLEIAVATIGASAVVFAVLDPVIRAALANDTALASAVAVAYPLFDLMLIAVIAGIASVPTIAIGRRWWALLTGLGIFTAADVVYALMVANDTYIVGTLLDTTWPIGLAFLTWWVAGVSRIDDPGVSRPRRSFTVPLPAVAVFAGLAVLVIATRVPFSAVAIVLAALTVALGAVPLVFRQAMLGRMLAAREETMRRLTELDQTKTDMLTTVNHEFRTPLTSINGHVELLLDEGAGKLPPAAMDMLRTIERNGARLQGLIDDTFSASQLEGLEGGFELSSVDVVSLVTRAVAAVEPVAARREVSLTFQHPDTALIVEADGRHLERALTNLIDNAVKFTEPGGHATVSVESARSNREAVIRVSDDGIGIPEDDIPRLFSRFFRASNVRRAAIPGVGLGLSTARQILHTHGGTVTAASTVGHGTTMTVKLPTTKGASSSR
jgi:signal transduction histidine kinase